ncbi:phage tail assembly chaperone [Pacificimonas sp. ICDLI1SI03]
MFSDIARRACGVACVRLGWAPEVFWAATPTDLMLALNGLLPPEADAPMTVSAMRALEETIDG